MQKEFLFVIFKKTGAADFHLNSLIKSFLPIILRFMRICLLFTPPTPDRLTEWLSDKKAMKGKNAHATLIKDSFRYHFPYSLLLLLRIFSLSRFPIVIIIIQSHRKAVVSWWYYWIEYKKWEWMDGNLFRLLFHHTRALIFEMLQIRSNKFCDLLEEKMGRRKFT